MAGEIQRVTTLRWTRSGSTLGATITETIDQVGRTAIENVQIVGATSESLLFGDVVPKYVLFKNENDAWSSLSDATKATYTSKEDYNTKNRVWILNAATAVADATATAVLEPQQGFAAVSPSTAWSAIRVTDSVNVLVVGITA